MVRLCAGAVHSSSLSCVNMPLTSEPSASMIVSLPPEKDWTVPALWAGLELVGALVTSRPKRSIRAWRARL